MKTFYGVLTVVDHWSERPPKGTRRRKVFIEWEAAMRALPTLIGSPLLDQHSNEPDGGLHIGIITWAEIIENKIWIAGELWYPLTHNQLSYEATAYECRAGRPLVIREITFRGAACVSKGAYDNTWIEVLEDDQCSDESTPQLSCYHSSL